MFVLGTKEGKRTKFLSAVVKLEAPQNLVKFTFVIKMSLRSSQNREAILPVLLLVPPLLGAPFNACYYKLPSVMSHRATTPH